MVRNCCPECFGDKGLRDQIFPFLSEEKGDCDFCGARKTIIVEPRKLANYFELVIGIYAPSNDGKLLVEHIKEDWSIFKTISISHAKDLLSDILDNGDIVRRKFSFSSKQIVGGLGKWDELRDEMMYRNRWFLEKQIDLDRLSELLDMLFVASPQLPNTWYRARIQTEEINFSIGNMGAPPKRRSSHGRANPAGIPYLYLGSKPETAVAEIRPHTGEIVCVADFIVPEIRVVDLRSPRETVSPFLLENSTEIAQLRADLPFLERLGDELTRPVLPSGAAIDYIPSQYLCEFIKKCGFDGVVYRSSVSDGMNLALFDTSKAKGNTVSNFQVSRVSVEVKEDLAYKSCAAAAAVCEDGK
ncbi:RES family NAD+ phosphorylase [Lautropia dentalis]|nr:RES family NAD+ phosphorylase [Lautropia dentalis]